MRIIEQFVRLQTWGFPYAANHKQTKTSDNARVCSKELPSSSTARSFSRCCPLAIIMERCVTPINGYFHRVYSHLHIKPEAISPPTQQSVSPSAEKKPTKSLISSAVKVVLVVLAASAAVPFIIKGIANVCGEDPFAHSWCTGKTNGGNVETATDECVSTYSLRVLSSENTLMYCCSHDTGGSTDCRNAQRERYIRKVLELHPYAKFTWSPYKGDTAKLLEPITKEIKEALEKLAQMSPEQEAGEEGNALRADIAKKLFIDLPKHCQTRELPQMLEDMRSKLCAAQLDRLYDQIPSLLSKQKVNQLWRNFVRSAHPDTGGSKEQFQKLDHAILECLQAKADGLLSCTFPECGKKDES